MLRQKGFTLVEMMIAMVLGLLIAAMVVTMFSATVGSSRQSLSTIRLNQELRLATDMITRDIRRAGFWAGASTAENPYTELTKAGTPLGVFDSGAYGTPVITGNCLILGYDSEEGAASTAERIVGYRLGTADDTVQVLWSTAASLGVSGTSDADCSVAGWTNLTDERTIEITGLNFALQPATLASFAESPVRQVTVSLTGRSKSDNKIESEVVDIVRIRNDLTP